MDCCTAGAQQQRRANAGSATLSAYVVAEHRLVFLVVLLPDSADHYTVVFTVVALLELWLLKG